MKLTDNKLVTYTVGAIALIALPIFAQ